MLNNNKNHKKKPKVFKITNIKREASGYTQVPQANVINLKEALLKKEALVRQRSERDFFGYLKINYRKFLTRPTRRVQPAESKEVLLKGRAGVRADESSNFLNQITIQSFNGRPRAILTFVVICFVLLSPVYALKFYQKAQAIKGEVLGVSASAYDHLKIAGAAAGELNLNLASGEFSQAADDFIKAQKKLDEIGFSVSQALKIVPGQGSLVSSGRHLLVAGENIASAGQDLSKALAPLLEMNLNQGEAFDFTSVLKVASNNFEPALAKVEKASEELKKVNLKAVPQDKRELIKELQTNLPRVVLGFDKFSKSSQALLEILGADQPKRYLILFQNNHEIRATGGFISSIAIADFYRGRMVKLEVPWGGPYDLNGQLTERIISPQPLHLVNPHWYIQDANWWPNFPTSAKKIMWFYEKSGGSSVDGIIALTPNLIQDLLKITGPIDLKEKYGLVIDEDNFVAVTEEMTKSGDERPKKFIAELVPLVLDKVLASQSKDFIEIFKTLNQNLLTKQLLFYFTDSNLERLMTDLDWAGELKEAPKDYLMVVDSNISGGKTDGAIDELINHQAEVQADGTIIDTVKLTRIHKGDKNDSLTGIKNMDYVRFYLPRASVLLDASGFSEIDPKLFIGPLQGYKEDADLATIEGRGLIDEKSGTRISEEFGKTVFGNWLTVEPGQSIEATIKYKLPFKLKIKGLLKGTDDYSLFVQKQSGSFGSLLTSELILPQSLKVVGAQPVDERLTVVGNKAVFKETLVEDAYYGVVVKK